MNKSRTKGGGIYSLRSLWQPRKGVDRKRGKPLHLTAKYPFPAPLPRLGLRQPRMGVVQGGGKLRHLRWVPPPWVETICIAENPTTERNKTQYRAKRNVTDAPASPNGEILFTCTPSPREGGPSQTPKFLLPSVLPSSPWLLRSRMHRTLR